MTRTCSLDGCETKHYGHGYCLKHYTRWRKHGDTETVKRNANAPTTCTLDGCDRPHVALGYCKRHHRAFKRYGDAAFRVDRIGSGAPNWQGGRMVTTEGYVRVKVYAPDPLVVMNDGSGYTPEHRIVVARAIGRPLLATETVHHINGQRGDNRIENLQLRSGSHGAGVALSCRACGSVDIEAVPLHG